MIIIPIKFDRLLWLLKERNMSVYHLTRDKIIGRATLDKIRKGEGHIDTRSIESLCAYLKVQPGDIMEYVSNERQDGEVNA